MFRTTFRPRWSAILACLCFLGSLGLGDVVWAQSGSKSEIGVEAVTPGAGWGSVPRLDNLDARLDFATQYTVFSDDDMKQTYDGLPLVSVGVSVQATTTMRTFFSLGYGRTTGDPYVGRAGISAPDASSVRTVPLQLGMKVDLTHSNRVHVNFGAAIEFAWMSETVPGLDNQGQPGEQTLSDVNAGYQLTFGPELVLGHGRSAAGLELGWGGSKGKIHGDNQRHDLSLTGYQGRLYFALEI